VLQQGAGSFPLQTTPHLHAVMGAGVTGQVEASPQSTPFRIHGGVHHPADPALNCRTGAHAAGLERHHQRATVEPPVTEQSGRLCHRRHLRMAQGILVAVAPVAAPAHATASLIEHHRGDRDLSGFAHLLRQPQQPLHPEPKLSLIALMVIEARIICTRHADARCGELLVIVGGRVRPAGENE
jgi:hypothetical protein